MNNNFHTLKKHSLLCAALFGLLISLSNTILADFDFDLRNETGTPLNIRVLDKDGSNISGARKINGVDKMGHYFRLNSGDAAQMSFGFVNLRGGDQLTITIWPGNVTPPQADNDTTGAAFTYYPKSNDDGRRYSIQRTGATFAVLPQR